MRYSNFWRSLISNKTIEMCVPETSGDRVHRDTDLNSTLASQLIIFISREFMQQIKHNIIHTNLLKTTQHLNI